MNTAVHYATTKQKYCLRKLKLQTRKVQKSCLYGSLLLITWKCDIMYHIRPKVNFGFPSTMSSLLIFTGRTWNMTNILFHALVKTQLTATELFKRNQYFDKIIADVWYKYLHCFLPKFWEHCPHWSWSEHECDLFHFSEEEQAYTAS